MAYFDAVFVSYWHSVNGVLVKFIGNNIQCLLVRLGGGDINS